MTDSQDMSTDPAGPAMYSADLPQKSLCDEMACHHRLEPLMSVSAAHVRFSPRQAFHVSIPGSQCLLVLRTVSDATLCAHSNINTGLKDAARRRRKVHRVSPFYPPRIET